MFNVSATLCKRLGRESKVLSFSLTKETLLGSLRNSVGSSHQMLFSSTTWDKRPEIIEVNVSSFVRISFRSPCCSISMSLTCFFSSLISLNNLVIFEGISFSLVGKQLAKSCETKSLDSSGFKEVTKSLVSWLMSGYKGLAFMKATSALALAFAYSSSSFPY
ncbi:hypothetical protein Tco_0665265 [Tanacetum coccineum]